MFMVVVCTVNPSSVGAKCSSAPTELKVQIGVGNYKHLAPSGAKGSLTNVAWLELI